jgi:hypothetical protein
MKKITTIILLLILSTLTFGQNFPVNRFKTDSVVWLGLDYTLARFVDRGAFPNPEIIVSTYIPKWNNMVYKEAEKYNIKNYFEKLDMTYNLTYSDSFNKEINPNVIIHNQYYSINKETLVSDVSKYANSRFNGIGVVMYTESYNKQALQGSYYLILLDLNTGDILYTEKITRKPSGFGITNFWIRTFYDALKSIKKNTLP